MGRDYGLSEGRFDVDDYPRSDSLDLLSQYCSEFLVHAADVEGLCQGIDEDLVTRKPTGTLSRTCLCLNPR